jgi:hypothetical protein
VPDTDPTAPNQLDGLIARHRCYGWWGMFAFLTLGVALEALHGLKAGFYLDPGLPLRRELWTLAHAHGTLFALVNLAWAGQLADLTSFPSERRTRSSYLLLCGSVLVPLGFFLGGAFATEHDPWSGVLLVPLGALCMLYAVGSTASAASRARKEH